MGPILSQNERKQRGPGSETPTRHAHVLRNDTCGVLSPGSDPRTVIPHIEVTTGGHKGSSSHDRNRLATSLQPEHRHSLSVASVRCTAEQYIAQQSIHRSVGPTHIRCGSR